MYGIIYIFEHERKLEADKAKYNRVMAFGGYLFEKSLYIKDSENPINLNHFYILFMR